MSIDTGDLTGKDTMHDYRFHGARLVISHARDAAQKLLSFVELHRNGADGEPESGIVLLEDLITLGLELVRARRAEAARLAPAPE